MRGRAQLPRRLTSPGFLVNMREEHFDIFECVDILSWRSLGRMDLCLISERVDSHVEKVRGGSFGGGAISSA